MALKIRLRQFGRNNRAFYRMVVTDVRAPRDGRYVESVGWYDPMQEAEKSMHVDAERVVHWLGLGAELSESAQSIIAKAAPNVIRDLTAKAVARRAAARVKRKARKESREKQTA